MYDRLFLKISRHRALTVSVWFVDSSVISKKCNELNIQMQKERNVSPGGTKGTEGISSKPLPEFV